MRQRLNLKAWLSALVLVIAVPHPALADGARELLAVVNATRAKAGCAPLRVNDKLMAAAQIHARAMAEQNFFGHTGKDGSKPSTRLKRQGYAFRKVAENIAGGQPNAAGVLESWLQSPPHRRNIRDCALTETGVAMVYQADDKPIKGQQQPLRYYWVQLFTTP